MSEVRRTFPAHPATKLCPRMNMEIATVNSLTYEDFVNIFGNVVENCPIITAAVWSRRPFVNLGAFESAISEFIDALPESGELYFVIFCVLELATGSFCNGTNKSACVCR